MTIELLLNWDGSASTGWVDYTDSVDMKNFTRELSLNTENDPQKIVSAEVEFFGDAFTEIKTELIDSANRYSNLYAVRITDTECANEEYYFKIEDRNFNWCDNGECRLNITLVEWNETVDCFKRTTIADNTYLDFQDYPASGMIHPRFRYCDVFKPTFAYYWLLVFTSGVTLIIGAIISVLNALISVVAWIYHQFGGNWNSPTIGFGFAEDVLGCKLGHPAPFIRTYIDNVCNLCGVSVTNTSMPIIFDVAYGGTTDNPYYYGCIVTAPTKKGVDMNGNKDYIPNNQPSWTGEKLLSLLKTPFNARWMIHDGVLWFHRKDLLGELIWGTSVSHINLAGEDAPYLLGEVCYKYNGKGKPKRLLYRYGPDSCDNIGNELKSRFDGEYIDTSGNKNFNETIESNLFEFGAVACILDGQDSAYDHAVDKSLAGLLTNSDYAGCMKTQGDTFTLAKMVIYNPVTPIEDARVWGIPYDIFGSSGADIGSFKDDKPDFLTLSSSDCWNYNWAFSFDPDANDISSNGFKNLWQFHEIDSPQATTKSNINIEFTLQFCCRYNTLNLFQTVILADGVTEAEIDSVKFNYNKREIEIIAHLKD